ncbi:MAG TPA: alpha/beta hydrolase [Nitrobacter sp.]|nr:alpha/beta hydrolase [Nitrobacter sp.]
MTELTHIRTPVLDIACEQGGPAGATPVVLLHGFPYDPRAFDGVVARLNQAGHRTIVPYLRGYGATRFLSPDTLRSGQQAALAQDLLDLLDALGIERAVLAGFDWGGRAACIVAALWPARVAGLISCGGYNLQNLAIADRPADPEQELRYWYQYYFNTERGRNGLADNRHALCKRLWTMWSPGWAFDDATYEQTATSFENEDFVDVVIHSYRHRLNNAPGDPRYDAIEMQLMTQPTISVPAIVIHGASDGVTPAAISESHFKKFGPRYERRVWPDAGHNPPQERPDAFAATILELCAASQD